MNTRLIPLAGLVPLALAGAALTALFHTGLDLDRSILYALVILTWLSLLGVILIYGIMTPWYRSRTGIGFMSTKISFFIIISLTIINALWWHVPTWLSMAAWAFIILTINFGITWNILYKQFFEHRADEMADKTTGTTQAGVHDTGAKETLMTETPGVGTPTPATPLTPVPGPDHRAVPVRSNAFWRTFLQVGIPAVLSLLVILPQVLQSILDGFGRQLPPDLYTVLVSITAGLTLAAAVLAKVMARPDVQAWLAAYAPFFAATKKAGQ